LWWLLILYWALSSCTEALPLTPGPLFCKPHGTFVIYLQGRHNASHDEDGSEEGEDDGDVEESYDNIEGNTSKPLCLEFLWDAECCGRLFLTVYELCQNCIF
jgi:hypothetical protein